MIISTMDYTYPPYSIPYGGVIGVYCSQCKAYFTKFGSYDINDKCYLCRSKPIYAQPYIQGTWSIKPDTKYKVYFIKRTSYVKVGSMYESLVDFLHGTSKTWNDTRRWKPLTDKTVPRIFKRRCDASNCIRGLKKDITHTYEIVEGWLQV